MPRFPRSSPRRPLRLAGALAALACGIGACDAPPPPPTTPPRVPVVVSLAPLAWPVEALLGERAEITVLVPPGASPHGFELAPSGVLALDRASFVLVAGGADDVVRRALSITDPRLISITPEGDHHHHHDAPGHTHDHPADEHAWLDPFKVRGFATAVAASLQAQGVADVDTDRLKEGLAAVLERRLEAKAVARRVKPVVLTGHDAWRSFFLSLDISEVTPLRRGHDAEPTASAVAEATRRAHDAPAVLVVLEAGHDEPWLRELAERAGAITVVLDPVGTRDWPADMGARYDAVRTALESFR